MSNSSRQFLQKVEFREIRTLYSVCEVLACGHRFESLTLLSDPLTAKHRSCPTCAKISAAMLPPKKPSISVSAEVERRRKLGAVMP